MTSRFYKYSFSFLLLFAVGLSTRAQQKCSDKPITSEFRKVQDKQQARKDYLKQTQQDPPQTNTTIKTQQSTTSPSHKPSQQPMRIPTRQKKQ